MQFLVQLLAAQTVQLVNCEHIINDIEQAQLPLA